MAHLKLNNWFALFIFSCLLLPAFGNTNNRQKKTHTILMNVNVNWATLENEISHTFTPNSEKTLIQLHLLNVIGYLENRPIQQLNEKQLENRFKNISTLKRYCREGVFPINNLSNSRVPIFIDSQNTHCAVGFLMKESGSPMLAREIAKNQLLYYLKNIKHPDLLAWQHNSGFSLFELALIQPTYGPPTPICASKTPVQWNSIASEHSKITQFFKNENENSIYTISTVGELGLHNEVKRYTTKDDQWEKIGTSIKGQILDLAICNKKIYVSVFLPFEDNPHQILSLEGKFWKEAAHFNGNINSIECFQKEIYVLGDYNIANDSIRSDLIIINEQDTRSFYNPSGRTHNFDNMLASETSIFFTSGGGIYQFKNGHLNLMNSIKYYGYLRDFHLSADADSLYLSSIYIPGTYKYFDKQVETIEFSNILGGMSYPYGTAKFTQTRIINGRIMTSGAFKSATYRPQINDNVRLIDCDEASSAHWYGEGLLYHFKDTFYPIQAEGAVLDFIHLNDKIYILKNDGNIAFAKTQDIDKEITEFRKRTLIK